MGRTAPETGAGTPGTELLTLHELQILGSAQARVPVTASQHQSPPRQAPATL